MNYEIKKLLTPFYFGAVEEEERLLVEREMLIDSEVLLDFLDLKRKLEAAEEIPTGPSMKLKQKFFRDMEPKKKMIFSISFGALVAAGLAFVFLVLLHPKRQEARPSSQGEILFDISRELPANSNVL